MGSCASSNAASVMLCSLWIVCSASGRISAFISGSASEIAAIVLRRSCLLIKAKTPCLSLTEERYSVLYGSSANSMLLAGCDTLKPRRHLCDKMRSVGAVGRLQGLERRRKALCFGKHISVQLCRLDCKGNRLSGYFFLQRLSLLSVFLPQSGRAHPPDQPYSHRLSSGEQE